MVRYDTARFVAAQNGAVWGGGSRPQKLEIRKTPGLSYPVLRCSYPVPGTIYLHRTPRQMLDTAGSQRIYRTPKLHLVCTSPRSSRLHARPGRFGVRCNQRGVQRMRHEQATACRMTGAFSNVCGQTQQCDCGGTCNNRSPHSKRKKKETACY